MVSVIIPVYNAEKYLRETLDCVVNQSMCDIEIICVDDNSTDNSTKILEEYGKSDNRFKIFHNCCRKGAAYARNRGLDVAKGEYVCFFDSDDIFEKNILKKMSNALENENVDIVLCEFAHLNNDNIYKHNEKLKSKRYVKHNGEECFNVQQCSLKKIYDLLTPQPCNKLFRRDFIEKNNLRFQDLENSNDVFFVTMALGLADRIVFLNESEVLYKARDHDTATRISTHRKPICAYMAARKIVEDIQGRIIQLEKFNFFFFCILRTIISGFNKTISAEEAESYYDFLNQRGIRELLEIGERQLPFVDKDIINKIREFKRNKYSKNTYYHDYILELCLEKEKHVIEEVFLKFREKNQKVGLWGVGYNGKFFYKFIQKMGYKIDYLGDKSLVGNEFEGMKILDISKMIKYSDVIIVSTDKITKSDVLSYININRKLVYDIVGAELS